MELYCGSCPFACASHARLKDTARYLVIDISSAQALSTRYEEWDLQAFFNKPYVTHLRRDLRRINIDTLHLWCSSLPGGGDARDIIGLHASFDCTTLSRAGACMGREIRTSEGGAISLAAQSDSKHLAALCDTMQALTRVAPTALITLENPWNGHFKEHRLIQELIERHGFWLYRTDFCAAATERMDGKVWTDRQGCLRGAVFPMKPSAMLLRNIPVELIELPRCAGTGCRMTFPGTDTHGYVVQNRAPARQAPIGGPEQQTPTTQGRSSTRSRTANTAPKNAPSTRQRQSRQQGLGAKGQGERDVTRGGGSRGPQAIPAKQTKIRSAHNSRVPLGLFDYIWGAHQQWQRDWDGHEYWCAICGEGGTLWTCTTGGCTAVQHLECSYHQGLGPWRCDDCCIRLPTSHTHNRIRQERDRGTKAQRLQHPPREPTTAPAEPRSPPRPPSRRTRRSSAESDTGDD